MQTLLLSLLLAVGLLGDWTTYTDKTQGYTVNYPTTWSQRQQNGAVIFLTQLESPKDVFSENVSIRSEEVSPKVSLKAYADDMAREMAMNMANTRQLSRRETRFAGSPAIEVEWLLPAQETNGKLADLRIKRLVVLHEGRAYVLSYTAEAGRYATFLALADQTLASFNFVR